ncbi:DUF4349 domain-containing protein [Actinomadura craniellae]|uniref:DUF4349 domain-containing protein n=1 Tax=Actinomadura craniellae TaxID=2231787 RepID=A0A365GXV7_9ACTN|nr:DUF4349 domain-containing protein [Actinomadura craniellae]RAY11660.1 DUF4349 domain-containing protein [Actinomadura craniellae]
MRTARNARAALLLALPLALLLAGCAGGSSESSSGTAEDAGGNAAPAAPAPAEGGRQLGGGGADNRKPAEGAGPATTDLPDNPTGRAVVYTADLRVRIAGKDGVEPAAARAKQLVTAAGGYVETERSSGATADGGPPTYANITFKIPAERYQAVLGQLSSGLGTRLSLRQEAEDVTEEVADVDSRVRSAEATLKSFRKLLDRANTVGEVINVEQEIARRQAELESLLARQKSLQHRTRLATVTLALHAPDSGGAKEEEERHGFVGGLVSGWNALVAFLTGLATVLGWLLPFLVLAAVLALPAWRLRRRLVRRRTPGDTPRPSVPPAAGGPAEPAPPN